MNQSEEKAQRLLRIEKLFWIHPEGLTCAALARRLGVSRSTITKYPDQLPPGIHEDDLDGNKLKMDRNADLTRAAFSLHEVMAIHLATRLPATRTDKQNPHAASALRKPGIALQRLDKNIGDHRLRSANVMDEEAACRDPVQLDVLEKLTEAWPAGRKLKVQHQMGDGRIFEYIFSPYFIEPYAVGQTAHVIGFREPLGAIPIFQIERLRSAQILHDRYEIPFTFNRKALLRNAWGIRHTKAEPVKVVLRFHPQMAMRVGESRWHGAQQIELQPVIWRIWRAKVAEPRTMLPWIRGRGADCEVPAPEGLRVKMLPETKALVEIYKEG